LLYSQNYSTAESWVTFIGYNPNVLSDLFAWLKIKHPVQDLCFCKPDLTTDSASPGPAFLPKVTNEHRHSTHRDSLRFLKTKVKKKKKKERTTKKNKF